LYEFRPLYTDIRSGCIGNNAVVVEVKDFNTRARSDPKLLFVDFAKAIHLHLSYWSTGRNGLYVGSFEAGMIEKKTVVGARPYLSAVIFV